MSIIDCLVLGGIMGIPLGYFIAWLIGNYLINKHIKENNGYK